MSAADANGPVEANRPADVALETEKISKHFRGCEGS